MVNHKYYRLLGNEREFLAIVLLARNSLSFSNSLYLGTSPKILTNLEEPHCVAYLSRHVVIFHNYKHPDNLT